MSISLQQLVQYTNDYLAIDDFHDYCPNGLQVQGKDEIQTIVSGVTACEALITKAIDEKADAILVHHGYFWKGESAPVVGMKQRRLKLLLENNISLLAYHLPLDAHLDVGNNIQLANRLGLQQVSVIPFAGTQDLVFQGRLAKPMAADAFADHISNSLARSPLHIAGGKENIETIALCTGGAQDYMHVAISAGVDGFISGEISERTVHEARENAIHYFACGHHATERYGVQALGDLLAQQFSLQHLFIDIDNPA